uniref:Uncharacterized protein n=1 Tax=Accipiter nisus TaxID=211598 RepID=A0A8B9MT65_9AVES
MMKLKSNQTRTYDGDGYKKRAACLCFRSESEEEVRAGGGLRPAGDMSKLLSREAWEEVGIKGRLVSLRTAVLLSGRVVCEVKKEKLCSDVQFFAILF